MKTVGGMPLKSQKQAPRPYKKARKWRKQGIRGLG